MVVINGFHVYAKGGEMNKKCKDNGAVVTTTTLENFDGCSHGLVIVEEDILHNRRNRRVNPHLVA